MNTLTSVRWEKKTHILQM